MYSPIQLNAPAFLLMTRHKKTLHRFCDLKVLRKFELVWNSLRCMSWYVKEPSAVSPDFLWRGRSGPLKGRQGGVRGWI